MATLNQGWQLAKGADSPIILLVEDDPFHALTIQSILERTSARVERAADAAQALILADHPGFLRRLALVIVVSHVPGLDGPGLVAELNERVPAVQVVVLRQPGEDPEVYRGRNAIVLPRYTPSEDLLNLCRRVLAQRRVQVA